MSIPVLEQQKHFLRSFFQTERPVQNFCDTNTLQYDTHNQKTAYFYTYLSYLLKEITALAVINT